LVDRTRLPSWCFFDGWWLSRIGPLLDRGARVRMAIEDVVAARRHVRKLLRALRPSSIPTPAKLGLGHISLFELSARHSRTMVASPG
jgi:hypothetical protein